MRTRLIVMVALAALFVALPAAASAKPAKGKTKCALKRKATCKKAKLKNVKVGKQNLSGANLKGATITGGTFTGTNLSNADLSNAKLTNVTFRNVDLSGATFNGARLTGVRFTGAQASAGRRLARGAMSCELVQGDGKYNVAFNCSGSSIDVSHMIVKNTVFQSARFPGADFSYTEFTSTGFVESSLIGANFYAATWDAGTTWPFSGDVLDGAMFDASTGVGIEGTPGAGGGSVAGASFLNAKRLTFGSPPGANEQVNGLDGPATVIVAREDGTAAPYSAITITGTWPRSAYSYVARCAPAKTAAATTGGCVRMMAKGNTATVTIETPNAIDASGGAFACSSVAVTGGYRTTCTGKVSENTWLTYAPLRYRVKVDSLLQSGAPTPMSKIRFESVSSAGTRTILTTCVLQTSCTAAVVPGTSVRVSVFREHSNGYFGMNCPGETGDAFTNMLTEWPTGDDTLSGDAGDTTRYALRRICPAFEVTGNVTLTAVNDSPDGAPSS